MGDAWLRTKTLGRSGWENGARGPCWEAQTRTGTRGPASGPCRSCVPHRAAHDRLPRVEGVRGRECEGVGVRLCACGCRRGTAARSCYELDSPQSSSPASLAPPASRKRRFLYLTVCRRELGFFFFSFSTTVPKNVNKPRPGHLGYTFSENPPAGRGRG